MVVGEDIDFVRKVIDSRHRAVYHIGRTVRVPPERASFAANVERSLAKTAGGRPNATSLKRHLAPTATKAYRIVDHFKPNRTAGLTGRRHRFARQHGRLALVKNPPVHEQVHRNAHKQAGRVNS